MSEIWDEAEKRIEELKKQLPAEIVDDKDILDPVLSNKLKRLERGKVVGEPVISNSQVIGIVYDLQIEPESKILAKIIGVLGDEKEVQDITYRANLLGEKLRGVAVSGEERILLSISFWRANRITINCYTKGASRIVDRIIEKLDLY